MLKRLLLALGMCAFITGQAAAVANLGIKMVTESIAFSVACLDSAGVDAKPDSAHIITYLDAGAAAQYTARDVSYPISGIFVDQVITYGDTTHWFVDVIGDIDGTPTPPTYTLAIDVITYCNTGIATHNYAIVQVVADSLNEATAGAIASLKPTTAGRTLDVETSGEAGVDLSNVNGVLSGAEIALTNAEAGWVDGSNQVVVATNNDKTGYTLTPAQVAGIADTITDSLTAEFGVGPYATATGFPTDKLGYTLTPAHVAGIADTITDSLTAEFGVGPYATSSGDTATGGGTRDLAIAAIHDTLIYIGEHGMGIFVDSTAANTNTVLGTDGTEKNPVSTLAAARTLALALGAHRFYIHAASTFNGATTDLAADYSGWEFYGEGFGIEIAFGGQLVTNSYFQNVTLSGAMHASGGDVHYVDCIFGYISANFQGHADNCELTDTIVVKAAADISFHTSYSGLTPGHTPTIDFGAGSNTVSVSHYSGGLRIMNGTADDSVAVSSDGHLIISANNTSLRLMAHGNITITDSGTTTILTKDAVFSREDHPVQNLAEYIGSPCDTSFQELFPFGSAPKDSVRVYCVSNALVDTTLVRTIIFYKNGGKVDSTVTYKR
jgi:hypothetical protein